MYYVSYLMQDLPNNLLNYGLYLLPSVPGKLGKYMDDGRCLGDYVFHGHVPRIEVSIAHSRLTDYELLLKPPTENLHVFAHILCAILSVKTIYIILYTSQWSTVSFHGIHKLGIYRL